MLEIMDRSKDNGRRIANSYINRIVEESRERGKNSIPFTGRRWTRQEVVLPDDFEALVDFIAPMIDPRRRPTVVLDFMDIQRVCALDIEKKTYTDNRDLLLLDITCRLDEVRKLYDELSNFAFCTKCIVYVMGNSKWDTSLSMADTVEIAEMFGKALGTEDILFGMDYDDDISGEIRILSILCFGA